MKWPDGGELNETGLNQTSNFRSIRNHFIEANVLQNMWHVR